MCIIKASTTRLPRLSAPPPLFSSPDGQSSATSFCSLPTPPPPSPPLVPRDRSPTISSYGTFPILSPRLKDAQSALRLFSPCASSARALIAWSCVVGWSASPPKASSPSPLSFPLSLLAASLFLLSLSLSLNPYLISLSLSLSDRFLSLSSSLNLTFHHLAISYPLFPGSHSLIFLPLSFPSSLSYPFLALLPFSYLLSPPSFLSLSPTSLFPFHFSSPFLLGSSQHYPISLQSFLSTSFLPFFYFLLQLKGRFGPYSYSFFYLSTPSFFLSLSLLPPLLPSILSFSTSHPFVFCFSSLSPSLPLTSFITIHHSIFNLSHPFALSSSFLPFSPSTHPSIFNLSQSLSSPPLFLSLSLSLPPPLSFSPSSLSPSLPPLSLSLPLPLPISLSLPLLLGRVARLTTASTCRYGCAPRSPPSCWAALSLSDVE
ncbi:hypothetical protein C7M84_016245 [Penaeus vannamei]|uniref:Uncharacterized protein n=1 Tax=Penaeus vannamei TaxID=6689 RepID=A0A423SNQ6_PENVA|nr:hypothetical protein C7M84_016245 [Penaeus vannamei]